MAPASAMIVSSTRFIRSLRDETCSASNVCGGDGKNIIKGLIMLRRELLSLLSLAALTFASALSPTPVAAGEDIKEIRIGFQRGGYFVALKQRHAFEEAFKAQGIGIKWVQFTSGPQVLEALAKGDLDYGNAGDAPAVFAQASGANIVYVAAVPGAIGNAVIVPENSPIKSIAELKEKGLPSQRAPAATMSRRQR
jgi:sulfonate transport system substrate-binding protein